MSKICGHASGCPYAPEQTTAGCPCAELCPGYCENTRLTYSTSTKPSESNAATTSSEATRYD